MLCKYLLTYMDTPKRKSTQERKSEIVFAALSLAAELGPGRMTTAELAKKVGVSHGAIFRHFATKEDIWAAVFVTIAEKMQQGWNEIEPSSSPLKRLRLLVSAQLRLVSELPALPSILSSRELHQKDISLKKGVMSLMKKFHSVLSGEIQNAIDSSEIRNDLNAKETANLVIAILQGTILRWSMAPKKFDLVEEGNKMFDQVMRGLKNNI